MHSASTVVQPGSSDTVSSKGTDVGAVGFRIHAMPFAVSIRWPFRPIACAALDVGRRAASTVPADSLSQSVLGGTRPLLHPGSKRMSRTARTVVMCLESTSALARSVPGASSRCTQRLSLQAHIVALPLRMMV